MFGWTTIDAGPPSRPAGTATIEELDPGLRARIKQIGAPEGFENVVATILPARVAQRAGA